jgi:hypothetical protein
MTMVLNLAVVTPNWAEETHPDIVLFFQAASSDEKQAKAALDEISRHWRDGYTPMFIDFARMMRAPTRARTVTNEGQPSPSRETLTPDANDNTGASDPGSPVRRRLLQFLKKRTGQKFGDDLDGWRRWMWSLPYDPHPEYAYLKAGIYRNVDPRMTEFLYPDRTAAIRLDEIDWGGVRVNGVPPLDHPSVIAGSAADYLDDDDVVFGVEVGGEPRAYPKRILGWHELVRDTVGETEITLVYCTMCGSVIPYESRLGDETLTFGTSGLLYRSNKLMFDEETMTLWSSLYGKPVVGPRVGSGQRLKRLPVVATTWGEWKAMHPETTVLSTDTGLDKDYSEGAAYEDYERNDRIWFEVPVIDKRLKNKDVVVTLARGGAALAVSRKFLLKNRIYYHVINGERIAFLTSSAGTTRAYLVGEASFASWGQGMSLRDPENSLWRVEEDALVAEGGTRLPRVATSPAYWFGWYAQYPGTELVK